MGNTPVHIQVFFSGEYQDQSVRIHKEKNKVQGQSGNPWVITQEP